MRDGDENRKQDRDWAWIIAEAKRIRDGGKINRMKPSAHELLFAKIVAELADV